MRTPPPMHPEASRHRLPRTGAHWRSPPEPALAQTGTIGNRTEFVFQVWVDPLGGCDVMATQRNPKGDTNSTVITHTKFALSTHPHGSISGRIQNAPYSFRTLTAALQYVTREFYTGNWMHNPLNYHLPWQLGPYWPENEIQIHKIVIHCLPGIYSPILQGETQPVIDPHSGLPRNGEVFPLRGHSAPGTYRWDGIPPGVSIQGASALDVIFDGRGREGIKYQKTDAFNYIFLFRPNMANFDIISKDSFIDSVTIRNVRSNPDDQGIGVPKGAGIVIQAEAKVQCIISNCIITDCDVGIAIDAYPKSPNDWLHSPVIVNNTIAWNRIGIWSGPLDNSFAGTYPNDHRGWSRPRIFNNIFDPRDPDSQFTGTGTSCWEGLDPTDMIIQLRIENSIPIGVNIDFNAYPDLPSRYNRTDQAANPPFIFQPPGWNLLLGTIPRSAPPLAYVPRVDIGPFMQPESRLFINDIFRVTPAPQNPGNNKNSRSPHDFRLSPMVLTGHFPPGSLNPLVNKGIDTSRGTLRFANHLMDLLDPTLISEWTPDIVPACSTPSKRTSTPGLHGPGAQNEEFAADFAHFHAWDWDCEGYGNPRIEERSDFPGPPVDVPGPPPVTHGTFIDLGADEMGTLIVAGYIDGTRIFSRRVPNRDAGFPLPSPDDDNREIFFFDRYYQGNAYVRPNHNLLFGNLFYYGFNPPNPAALWVWHEYNSWWHYYYYRNNPAIPIQPNPDSLNLSSNFTEGSDYSSSYSYRRVVTNFRFPNSNYEFFPFMRNLECDFSPHLLPDIHPNWANLNPGWAWNQNPWQIDNFADVFASNPWYHAERPNATPEPWAEDFVNRFLYYDGFGWDILEGTINPPGTWLFFEGEESGYLRTGSWYQFGNAGTYTVNPWGFGDVVVPTYVPDPDLAPEYSWQGARFNLQRGAFENYSILSNLQTFLVVNGIPLPEFPPVPPAPLAAPGPGSTQAQLLWDLYRAWRRMDKTRKR